MTFNIIITVIAVVSLAANLCAELKRDLMMFQQNSYRPERYGKWLSVSGDSTSMWRLGALAILFLTLSTFARPWISMILGAGFGCISFFSLTGRKYKKPLVWTARSKRIYTVALLSAACVAGICEALFFDGGFERAVYLCALALLGCYCGSHILILAANIILKPVEKSVTARYINDARRILREMPDLKIIGITGSYGKTSTKHYLCHILSSQFDTLMTPGSYNTTLGVVRTVRELLKPYNEVFIVEMGAKNPGDIKEICDLVHPTMGIVTAVGPQHLESFKTIKRVQATKFELADSLPADGVAIVNDDFEKIADRPVTNANCIRYAVRAANADYKASDVKYTPSGTTFTVEGPDEWHLKISTRLMGECNVSDLLAAIAAAHILGVADTKIAAAVASIEPVEHRLSVKRTAGGITILDDAFNSNPVGSRMALEVLGSFTDGRRIVITPGMIELGQEQYDLNREFGRHIAKNADIAIVVGEYNRAAILDGLKEEKFPDAAIHTPDTFAEAQKILGNFAKAGDTMLYENDLPDTFK